MPRVHRFLDVKDVRSRLGELEELGLHAGVDLTQTESLFGTRWDREARELGRMLRGRGRRVIVRGPGEDHPLGARDSYVFDQVRACHDRAMTAAAHYGAEHYLVRLSSSHGLPRSARIARRESTVRMVRQLSASARTRGMVLAVEQHLENDPDTLEAVADLQRSVGGGLVFAPALAVAAGHEDDAETGAPGAELMVGLDLTDRRPQDLEPRAPGSGVLGGMPSVAELLNREGLEFVCVSGPVGETRQMVTGLNELAERVPGSVAP